MENERSLFEQKKEISEGGFVKVLLNSLYNNGVSVINEDELCKKLYAYSVNPEYRHLFTDIENDRYDEKVCLLDAIFQEKNQGGHITWLSNDSRKLFLDYKDCDLSFLKKRVNPETILKIEEIGCELSIMYNIEKQSQNNLHIYKKSPNGTFTNLKGFSSFGKMDTEIITNGDISLEKRELYRPGLYFSDPTGTYMAIMLKEEQFDVKRVKIQNADYTIVEGICDYKTKRTEAYFENIEEEFILSSLRENNIINKPYMKTR